jgi:hypothetical protein
MIPRNWLKCQVRVCEVMSVDGELPTNKMQKMGAELAGFAVAFPRFGSWC